MIELNVPGHGVLSLQHVVLDVNGTIAVDGQLVEGVFRRVAGLKDRFQVHMLTANTHGAQDTIDTMLALKAVRLTPGEETAQKARYVQQLTGGVVAIGQGANDAEMLRAATLGIAVHSPEGLAVNTLLAAKIVVPSIVDALDLLDKPLRLIATLRQ